MQKNDRISNSVIRRLPRYYRFLGELLSEGEQRISSRELAEKMSLTASQIRQDLNCFGGFGQQGYGYNVRELRDRIGGILGLNKSRGAVLIGAGNLGRALAVHFDYDRFGCRLIGIFDNDKTLTGKELSSLRIMPMNELESFCRNQSPEIAILCIPKDAAPGICEKLVELGVRAFWNFSHYDIGNIGDSENLIVENVHLGDSLMVLCYGLNSLDPYRPDEKD